MKKIFICFLLFLCLGASQDFMKPPKKNVYQLTSMVSTNEVITKTVFQLLITWDGITNGCEIYYSTNLINWAKYGETTNSLMTISATNKYTYFRAFEKKKKTGSTARVSLAWDASSSVDIAGYKLYLGNEIENYKATVSSNVFSYTFPNLTYGRTYRVVATAYDSLGTESLPSNEVVFEIPWFYSLYPLNIAIER